LLVDPITDADPVGPIEPPLQDGVV